MKRLGIFQKVFLLLFVFVFLTLSMGGFIYLSMQDFDKTRAQLETLHNFQLQIQVLQKYHLDPTKQSSRIDEDQLRQNIEKARLLVQQIRRFHINFEQLDDLSSVYNLMEFYSQSAFELSAHNKIYMQLVEDNIAITQKLLKSSKEHSEKENSQIFFYFTALNSLRDDVYVHNNPFDNQRFHELKKEIQARLNEFSDDLRPLLADFLLNHEKLYIENLSIQSSLDYLNKSNERFLQEAEEDIGLLIHQSYLQQRQLRTRIVMLGSFTLLVACLLSLITSLRLKHFLSTMQHSISNIKMGNYDYDVSYTQDDETGDLVRFIKGLALNLKNEIRERHETQDQLRQAQKMEAIGTLAGGIAHDFNNLLTAIDGYSQLIQLEPGNEERVKEYVEKLRKGNQRARDLVKQILTFSRKQKSTELHPLNLAPIIKETTKLLKSSLPKNIQVDLSIDTYAPVLADPTQIHQVVMNLCTNAYQAMREDGGILTISLNEKEILSNEIDESKNKIAPGRYLSLEISDTGGGIDQDHLERIFEPYFTTKPSGEGTGLGLSVVHGIIESCKGSITVTSKPGQTTFHILLPIHQQEAEPLDGPPDEPVPTGQNERLMLVDDEKDICLTTKKLLEKNGYRVDIYTNGVEAMQCFEEDIAQYDLLITDMSMPYMSGVQLAHKIREIRPDCPIILCTGFNEMIDQRKARKIGFDAYLEKPVNLVELLRTIRDVLPSAEQV